MGYYVIVGSGFSGATSGLRIITYLNDGNGNYTAGSLVSISIPDISWIELSDTDGDGDLDLFVASSTYVAGGIYWFKNFGNGTFGSSMTINEWSRSRATKLSSNNIGRY